MKFQPYEFDPMAYQVRRIGYVECKAFVLANHYAKGMSNAATACYGLFDHGHLIGALVFATPCSEAVRASVFGDQRRATVTELHRLVILDVTPCNAESYFIARCLNALRLERPDLAAVVSFADEGRGHVGTIYQATNGVYYGAARACVYYVDPDGRHRHRRQCGVNISLAEAQSRGWTARPGSKKHRYCFLLPKDRRHRRELAGDLLLTPRAYPKMGSTMLHAPALDL